MFVVPCRATEGGRRESDPTVLIGRGSVVMVLPVYKECYISYSSRLSLNYSTVSINVRKKRAVHIEFVPPRKRKRIATFQHFPRSIYLN